jgi:hypothetical protein
MIDIQHSNERNFCGAITPKEKDKIMKAILDMAAHERKTFCFTPNDVPGFKILSLQRTVSYAFSNFYVAIII